MLKNKTAIAFDRVSSDDQKRDGFSLEAQEKLSKSYAKGQNLMIVKRWSVSESASKENERSHFFEMIDYVRDNKIGDVIFDKVDRACRGLKSAQMIEELVEKNEVRFHFTRENLIIDVNSPSSDKLRFYLHVILAKYYIDNLKTEIKKGLSQRTEMGFWNHKAPIGYKNVRPEGETKADRGKATIEIDKDCAPYVIEAFELYATGNYGLRDLIKFFSERIKTRIVAKSTIEVMISNPFYYGAMRTNKIITPGKHPPLISKALWDACQKIKGIRADGHGLNAALLHNKPFMGLMRCGVCGHLVTGQVKLKSSGKTYIYYHCANTQCTERRNYVPQAKIEEQVIRAFEPFKQATPAATEAFVTALKAGLGNMEFYTHKMIGELATEKELLRTSEEKIKKLQKDGKLSETEAMELIKTKQQRTAQVEVEIQATLKVDKETAEQGIHLIELLRYSYDFMTFSTDLLQKAHLAKSVLSNSILKNGTLSFSYKKPFDVLIELTSKKNWWRRRESNPSPWPIGLPIYVLS
jgi:site-specific DNA recombinase